MNSTFIKALAASLLLFSSACRHTETVSTAQAEAPAVIHMDPAVYATAQLDWSALSEYVAMKIPYEPIAKIKKQIEEREAVPLKSRGEAHITIVAPKELAVLRTRLSLEQINGLMEKMSIQATPIQLQCLGRGQSKQGNKRLLTYFLVVNSPGLQQIREKLRQQFMAAGGDRQAFGVDAYYPHITVGYTDRDLFFDVDGVVKDSKSCAYRLE